MENSRFQFLGYKVPEFSLEVKDNYISSLSLKNNLSVNIQKNFAKDNNRFVEVVLFIKLTNENESLKLNLTIKGGFLADKEMPEELFEQTHTVSAPAVLYPYARAIISTCTAQAAIPQIILPLMNFTSVASESQLSKSDENDSGKLAE